jgi:hypothetical protein
MAQLLANLESAKSAVVKPCRLRVPRTREVLCAVLCSGRCMQVFRSIVGPISVDVVNLLLGGDVPVEHAVLVGLDVMVGADQPSQPNVAIGIGIPARLTIGDLLPRTQVGGRVSGASGRRAFRAETNSITTGHLSAARFAINGSQTWWHAPNNSRSAHCATGTGNERQGMSCVIHHNLCAFPEPSDDRCSFCHCDWSKITAPATRKVGRETRYLDGYGETPLNHLWRHAADYAFAEADAVRRAASRRRGAA